MTRQVSRRSVVRGLASLLPASRAAADEAAAHSLKLLAGEKGIIFGTTVARYQMDECPLLPQLVTAQAAMIVPGLELKWDKLRPGPDQFDFANADFLLQRAEANGQAVRGVPLVWHEALPTWFAGVAAEPGTLQQQLTLHVDTVASRYAGRIHSWDVVNEPIEPFHGRADGLRQTPFLSALGPEYIDLTFHQAAACDPSACLVLNEYGLEMASEVQSRRREATLDLLRGLMQRRVPVHALGVQAHLTAGEAPFDPELFRRFVHDVASLGLDVYVTELDVADRLLPADITARDRGVAEAYKAFLDATLAEDAVKVVVLWGITDRYTWMNDSRWAKRPDRLPVRAHPYDDEFRPKPAWDAIAGAFAAAPSR